MPESLRLVWMNENSYQIALSLAASRGTLFASGFSSFSALDINTGSVIQHYEVTHFQGFPAVKDNRVYLNVTGGVYCLDVDTGKVLWSHQVEFFDFLSYPIVIDGKVVVGGGRPVESFPPNSQSTERLKRAWEYTKKVMCLDAETGELIWEFYAKGRTVYSPAYFDGKIYVNTESSFLHCLDAETGELIWEKIIDWNSCVPLSLDGERIFVGTYEGILCLDIETGETLWKFNSKSNIFRTPVVAYNNVFASADEILYCVDAEIGNVIWELKVESPISTPIIAADKKIAFGTAHGVLCIVNAKSGEISEPVDLHYVAESHMNEITSVILSDGKLIVGQGGGRITCFEGSDHNLTTFILIFVMTLFVAIYIISKKVIERSQ
jgi:outer membrane protein assembly factor BamB